MSIRQEPLQTISGLVIYLNSMKLSTKNYQSLIQHAKTWTGLPVFLILPVYTPASQKICKNGPILNQAQPYVVITHVLSGHVEIIHPRYLRTFEGKTNRLE